jgi:hypothetical protein
MNVSFSHLQINGIFLAQIAGALTCVEKKYVSDYSAITITHFVQTVRSCHKTVHNKVEYGQTEYLIWSKSNNDPSRACTLF